MLSGAYEQAGKWLAEAESYSFLVRFKAAGQKLAARVRTKAQADANETLFRRPNVKRHE